ncbi:unnamed protein product, partial [Mesorhabditis spiculigera]
MKRSSKEEYTGGALYEKTLSNYSATDWHFVAQVVLIFVAYLAFDCGRCVSNHFFFTKQMDSNSTSCAGEIVSSIANIPREHWADDLTGKTTSKANVKRFTSLTIFNVLCAYGSLFSLVFYVGRRLGFSWYLCCSASIAGMGCIMIVIYKVYSVLISGFFFNLSEKAFQITLCVLAAECGPRKVRDAVILVIAVASALARLFAAVPLVMLDTNRLEFIALIGGYAVLMIASGILCDDSIISLIFCEKPLVLTAVIDNLNKRNRGAEVNSEKFYKEILYTGIIIEPATTHGIVAKMLKNSAWIRHYLFVYLAYVLAPRHHNEELLSFTAVNFIGVHPKTDAHMLDATLNVLGVLLFASIFALIGRHRTVHAALLGLVAGHLMLVWPADLKPVAGCDGIEHPAILSSTVMNVIYLTTEIVMEGAMNIIFATTFVEIAERVPIRPRLAVVAVVLTSAMPLHFLLATLELHLSKIHNGSTLYYHAGRAILWAFLYFLYNAFRDAPQATITLDDHLIAFGSRSGNREHFVQQQALHTESELDLHTAGRDTDLAHG